MGLFDSLQWFPRSLKWQLLYLSYRWILAIYFLCWFVVIIVNSLDYIKWKYLIYISNWAFMIWLAYLIISGISLSIKFVCQLILLCKTRTSELGYEYECRMCQIDDCECTDCQKSGKTPWSCSVMEKSQWLLFTVGTEFAVAITLLYWTIFYQPHSKHNFFSLDSLHIHLVNGILALVDLWMTGVPIRVYHALYSILFALSYVAFTGVYYAAGGTDPTGNSFIYPLLNYRTNPGSAVGLGIMCALLLMTVIHFVFFILSLVRNWITSYIQRQFYSKTAKRMPVYKHLQVDTSSSELAL